jgi:hypothetical protein
MAKVCSICQRPDRAAIEERHVQGSSLRVIASQFGGTSPWSLQRHFAHVPAIIAKVREHQVQQNRSTARLPARVEQLIVEAEAITMMARKNRNFSAALAAIRTRLACLETIGRLTGELRPSGSPLGEFIPGNAAAAAQASVTINLPEPEREKTWSDLDDLLRNIYGLTPRRELKNPPVM